MYVKCYLLIVITLFLYMMSLTICMWSYLCLRIVLPIVLQIADLSRDFKSGENPLRTLRSVDLLPGSWLSVAWYPIYRIPTGPTLRDLAACFLTFHSLSSSLHGGAGNLLLLILCAEINLVSLMYRFVGSFLHCYMICLTVWCIVGVENQTLVLSLVLQIEHCMYCYADILCL